MAIWYVDSAQWSSVTAWASNTSKTAGNLIRQNATPTVGNERVFVALTTGTTTNGSEPTWTVTKGGKTTDTGVTWQECTGQPAVNGDSTNTPLSSSVRSTNPGAGKIIQDNSGTHYFIASVAGSCGSGEPSYNTTTLGNTTTDGGTTWVYIGLVASAYSTWSGPHARLANAFATNWGAAGDSFYLGDDHAETQASAMTQTSPGTVSNPCFVYSVDHTASHPPASANLSAGASCATTGANNLTGAGGSSYYYGVTWSAGSGAVAALLLMATSQSSINKFDSCTLKKLGSTASANAITLGPTAQGATRIQLFNTTLSFGATGDSLFWRGGNVTWRNTASAIGGTVPTQLFNTTAPVGSPFICEGVDLSAIASGSTIVPAIPDSAQVYLIDCKLASGVIIAATPSQPGGVTVDAIRCDSAGTSYAQHRYHYQGTLDHETTVVRTGGASDGTTPLAWKITTTANSKWFMPFEAFPISIWNAVTGASVTATVYGIWGGGAVPNNDDIWIDVEYLGDSGSPRASLASGTKSTNLAAGTPLSSDGSSWGGSTTPFKATVSFTPQLAGYVRIYVRAAKVSTTFYIDPAPQLH